jgi:hypothetical protein
MGVHHHDVPLADEAQHGRQLGPVHVFARGLVGERAVDGKTVDLPGGVLIQGAHPGVSDSLPAESALPRRICQVGLHETGDDVSINHDADPNLTMVVRGGSVSSLGPTASPVRNCPIHGCVAECLWEQVR